MRSVVATTEAISPERDRMRRVEETDGMHRASVERAMRGDHDAFAELVRASIDRLYAMASLILRDGDRAQDAVQEALVAAWRDIRGLRDPDAWGRGSTASWSVPATGWPMVTDAGMWSSLAPPRWVGRQASRIP